MIVERGTIFYVEGERERREKEREKEKRGGEGEMWKYSKVILQLLKIIGRNFL